jgi:hypothetical protein
MTKLNQHSPRYYAVWINQAQAAHNLLHKMMPWCTGQLNAGNQLVVDIRLPGKSKSDSARNYYHGVVLTEISKQAKPYGVAHALPIWKEFFRAKFLGSKDFMDTNPMTGEVYNCPRRISTESLDVREYAEFIEQVTAFAVTELGVMFPADKHQETP